MIARQHSRPPRKIEDRSWEKLPAGTPVKMLVEVRYNDWNAETGHYDIPKVVRIGRVGVTRGPASNAGFRGVEHTIVFPNGQRVHGINATQVTRNVG